MRFLMHIALLITACGMLAAGCASKPRPTFEGYSAFTPRATTQAEVVAAFGNPDQVMDNQWYYSGVHREQTCIIEFDSNGYLARKQWMDAANHRWHDSQEATRK